MLSLIAPKFGEPSCWEVVETPDLTIKNPTAILIEVHASSINGHDVIMASGKTKMLQVLPMPYPIGLDFAGVVLDVGDKVHQFAQGDKVYGFNTAGGAAATHLVIDTTKPHAIWRIPAGLDMVQAASLPAVAITADLALKRADEYFKAKGGLSGKTVFIPGALSGVGSMALQIAKKKWSCRTITAASTAKIPQISKYLGEGVVDSAFDYTQVNVVKEVGSGKVDFVFDTTGLAADYLPMIRNGGLCVSIARLPPGTALKSEDPDAAQQPRVACIGQNVMDGLDSAFRMWAKTRYGVTYEYQRTMPVSEDMEAVSKLIDDQNLRAVVGKTARLSDIDQIRSTSTAMLKGKGGIGKFVIEVKA
jgi:NADPH:quinone reductase-like Zn-dependent oxidoreductase